MISSNNPEDRAIDFITVFSIATVPLETKPNSFIVSYYKNRNKMRELLQKMKGSPNERQI